MQKKHYLQKLTRSVYLCLLAGAAAFCAAQPVWANTVIAGTQLPSGGRFLGGQAITAAPGSSVLNIRQTAPNAVITWKDFSVGANAAVNFSSGRLNADGRFNTLNYVNGGNVSRIYGTINARNGNIFIVNPSGVQISRSAQINVGSLYVSNKKLDESRLAAFDGGNIASLAETGGMSNAELMSLGSISAEKVVFDGGRIVLDTDRLRNAADTAALAPQNIAVNTSSGDVVLGYDGFDRQTGSYGGAGGQQALAMVNGKAAGRDQGYAWVDSAGQLQAIATDLQGSYALRGDIDASPTEEWMENGSAAGFKPLGGSSGFSGRFDGLGNNIYNITINRGGEDNVGIFGHISGGQVKNVNIIGGSISGRSNVGALAGLAENAVISNVKNAADVSGAYSAGGIVGSAVNSSLSGLFNSGSVRGSGLDTGGIAGSMRGSSLDGGSGNVGSVLSAGGNTGGIAGSAAASVIGSSSGEPVYNHMDVTGAYNVGGIAGRIASGTVLQNAFNDAPVLATGSVREDYFYHSSYIDQGDPEVNISGGRGQAAVSAANAGGLAGLAEGDGGRRVLIRSARNSGSVASALQQDGGDSWHLAGNVGGIAGKVVSGDIVSVQNMENTVRGAHNVGGIAGYLEDSSVSNTYNNGGDIMATGARYGGRAVREIVRRKGAASSKEIFIIGNTGGIAGYMYGDGSYITESANRGRVHSREIEDPAAVKDSSKAANVGGIAGKIDRSATITAAGMEAVKQNYALASVSSSFNSSGVEGYTGVGGIAGFMYNGEIAGSYNLGRISSTRRVSAGVTDPVNMGGIVGDSTEQTSAQIYLYDVYNKGQVGDSGFVYSGRHVGGIAGRLSGTVEKAFNNGDIFNSYSVTGGIAGWWTKGALENVFNTGNITVLNRDSGLPSSAGGIIGSAGAWDGGDVLTVNNAYNLGAVRSFASAAGRNSAGGIIGELHTYSRRSTLTSVSSVYTVGSVFAGTGDVDSPMSAFTPSSAGIGGIFGLQAGANDNLRLSGAHVIEPESGNIFRISAGNAAGGTVRADVSGQARLIPFEARKDPASYSFGSPASSPAAGGAEGGWRIYENTLPILNAFLPASCEYFSGAPPEGVRSVQYGTAYNPLLTIVRAEEGAGSIALDWREAKIANSAGLAVYGAGLKLENFSNAADKTGTYGGTIYADGDLQISGARGENLKFNDLAGLYGSSVSITGGSVTVNGGITATGSGGDGGINISAAGDVTVYGQLKTAAAGTAVSVGGITDGAGLAASYEGLNVPGRPLASLGQLLQHTSGRPAERDGSLTVSGRDISLLYGQLQQGLVQAGGGMSLTGRNIYLDSDLDAGGSIVISGTGEKVADISNIGRVRAPENPGAALHGFLDSFAAGSGSYLQFDGGGSSIIGVDLWDGTAGRFDTGRYDAGAAELDRELAALDVRLDGVSGQGAAEGLTYIWIADGRQLAGVQPFLAADKTTGGFAYNFALKKDINAAGLSDYVPIGSGGDGFAREFDGRGRLIVGLNTAAADAGVFGSIASDGQVRGLGVNAGRFYGADSAGGVAGVSSGRIENVSTFGNVVRVTGTSASLKLKNVSAPDAELAVGAAGGIAGVNYGVISGAFSEGAVIADSAAAAGVSSAAGGIAGINAAGGLIADSTGSSAVTSSYGGSYALGGIAAVNAGSIRHTENLGLVRGVYYGADGPRIASETGGIAGYNSGSITNVYNESDVTGGENTGGIAGINSGSMEGISNAGSINRYVDITEGGGFSGIGGLAGRNVGEGRAAARIASGRNNGAVYGWSDVGGMVGYNGAGSSLENLTNDSSADIFGENYVGGITGRNAGVISADEEGLVNRGRISGQNYVGGTAGANYGVIRNTNNSISLAVRDAGRAAMYFGGVTGVNAEEGTIENATNRADIRADGAVYAGGIAGRNDGVLLGMNGNYGSVRGASHVGGVVGSNTSAITGVNAANAGTVTALAGGAGGIFGTFSGSIVNSYLENKGTVTGYGDGGTGGIATASSGAVEDSVLVNSGAVCNDGGSNVGGIFGINSGSISRSSLINQYGGQVSGRDNVGGLFGASSGAVTGGRSGDGGYYSYRIYNNGHISGRDNVGGLAGVNSGAFTAAYNTGSVQASGSNAGGIAGMNGGVLDQVFSSIMTEDGLNAAVSAAASAGGIAGSNLAGGVITNAYSTGGVTGSGAGALAGVNNGVISKAYGYGRLIGGGAEADRGFSIDGGGGWKQLAAYEGFGSEWKNYDGYTTPLLRVFLTGVSGYGGSPALVYNGRRQQLDIGALQVRAADNLQAYANNNSLIVSAAHKDAGVYSGWLYSAQLAASGEGAGFYPNNLGYDLEYTGEIRKAELRAETDDIYRVYGSSLMYADSGHTEKRGGYGGFYRFSALSEVEGLEGDLKKIAVTAESDAAMMSETRTAGAGSYDWGIKADISAIAGNYSFEGMDKDVSTASFAARGKSHVARAPLVISVADAGTVYGTAFDESAYGYSFGSGAGPVNGDTAAVLGSFGYTNAAAGDGAGGKVTAGAGRYEKAVGITGLGSLANYSVTVSNGAAEVRKARLTAAAGDLSVSAGGAPRFSGVLSGIANGDTYAGVLGSYSFAADGSVDTGVPGVYSDAIGLLAGGVYHGAGFELADYYVAVDPGTLTVLRRDVPAPGRAGGSGGEQPVPAPQKPDGDFSAGRYGRQTAERSEEDRERRAEISFVRGGMEL